jgi:hypothetical protein
MNETIISLCIEQVLKYDRIVLLRKLYATFSFRLTAKIKDMGMKPEILIGYFCKR